MTATQITPEARRHVERFLDFSGHVGGLAEDDVLALLREQGIGTLQELVGKALAAPRSAAPTRMDHARLLSRSAGTAAAREQSVTHRAPAMAVVLDGVEHDPADLSRYDGRPLTYVYGTDRLVALTDDSALNGAVWAAAELRAAMADPRPPTQGEVQMFEHVDYGGDWFWLAARHAYNDLRGVHHGPLHVHDWNDEISSLGGTNCAVRYYEHINFSGSSFFVPPNTDVPNLVLTGWNDRISSVWNIG
ncbi:peptidase inhibitor family I36 protein [Nonomuraea wenchangensis]